jgi:hypothetical protein
MINGDMLKESVVQASQEYIPKMERTKHKEWMTEDILQLIETRRKKKDSAEEYSILTKEIKSMCDKAKEERLNHKCKEMEANRNNTRAMHTQIKEITRKKPNNKSGCLKSSSGEMLIEKAKIVQRWTEYIQELYNDDREDTDILFNDEGPPILVAEVKDAIKQTRQMKAPGPDNITIEQIQALGKSGQEILTKMFNDMYSTGYLPEDLKKSIYIPLPKKERAVDCEDHRTISLMSHVTKIFTRIILKRMRNKINPEIADEQCGFVADKSTSNAIFILRTLVERSIEVQVDLYLCFIDYTKAFDKVKHNKMLEIMNRINIDGKDLRIIKNLYWEQTAAVRIDNEIGPFQQIKRGVRQGCIISPDLFSLYSEIIMRHITDMPGISVGGHNINNLRYADDTILIATNERDLQALIDRIVDKSEIMGLSLNKKKTEVMITSKKNNQLKCSIMVDGTILKQVNNFKYLGTVITSDGRCTTEVKCRIRQAKVAFQKMRNILCNKNLSMEIRKQVLKTYVNTILFYGSEAWTMNKGIEKRLEATEMWFWRRMLKVPWTDKITNENILKQINEKRKTIKELRKKQSGFIGHILRKGKLENIVTTGKINGRKDRGRQREKMLDSLTKWHGRKSTTELIACTRDRESWRNMTANVYRQGTS